MEVPIDVRDERVVLAVALVRPGVAESDVEAASSTMPTRFQAIEMDVADSHAASLRQAPLQIGRLNLRLMLERDTNDGYSSLCVARILERRPDGRVLLDPAHMPPLLHVVDNAVADGFLREIIGLLHQRGESLAARLAQPGRAGVGEIADFLLLQICNRYEPQLTHARKSSVLHAEHLYSLLLSLTVIKLIGISIPLVELITTELDSTGATAIKVALRTPYCFILVRSASQSSSGVKSASSLTALARSSHGKMP